MQCLVGLFLSLGVPIAVIAESSRTAIKVCIDSESYPPYIFDFDHQDGVDDRRGLIIDLISFSAEYAGATAVMIRKPWRRCLADVESGLLDATAPVIWSKARQRWARFPQDENNQLIPQASLWSVDYRVFALKDSTLQWDGKHFSGIRYGVAAPLGHISHKRLKGMGVLPSSSFTVTEGMTMVSRGFLDGFVNESLSGQYFVEQLSLDQTVSFQSVPFISTELYLVFSQRFKAKKPEVVSQVFEGLMKHKASWKAQLLEHYQINEPKI